MKKIKNLGTKLNKKGMIESWGEFYCEACKRVVEKTLGNGTRQNYCGCTFGQTKTKIYSCWECMKQRCLNPNATNYPNYGGRGITICNEWLEFIPFRDWALNNGYQEGLEIDRRDTNGNYEPSNCRWVTRTENKLKQRRIKLNLEKANEIRELYKTGNYTRKELADKYNVSIFNIDNIIYNKIWKNICY